MARIPSTECIQMMWTTMDAGKNATENKDRASTTIATKSTWLRLATPTDAAMANAAADTAEATSAMKDAPRKHGNATAVTTSPRHTTSYLVLAPSTSTSTSNMAKGSPATF